MISRLRHLTRLPARKAGTILAVTQHLLPFVHAPTLPFCRGLDSVADDLISPCTRWLIWEQFPIVFNHAPVAQLDRASDF